MVFLRDGGIRVETHDMDGSVLVRVFNERVLTGNVMEDWQRERERYPDTVFCVLDDEVE